MRAKNWLSATSTWWQKGGDLPKVVLLLAAALGVRFVLASPFWGDPMYDTVLGNWILAHGHVPLRDHWSWTFPGARWIDQEWGWQAILGAASALGAYPFYAAGAVFVALLPFLIYLLARELGSAGGPSALLSFLATVLMSPFLNLRPQVFSYDALTVLLWLVARERNGKGGLYWVLPLTLLWAQVHGSFVLAPLFLALALVLIRPWKLGLVENRGFPAVRRLAVALGGASLAPLVNPNGFGLWSDVLSMSGSSTVHRYISEWGPPSLGNPAGELWWFIPVLGVVGVLLVAPQPRIDAYGLVLAAGCVWEAFASERMLPYALITVFGFLLGSLAWGETKRFTLSWLNALLALGLILAVYLLGPYPSPTLAGSVRTGGRYGMPKQAIGCVLARHLRRVAFPYDLAAYAMWAGIPTMIDTRADFFLREGLFLPFSQVEEGKKAPVPFFRRWRVGAVVWRQNTTVARELEAAGWRPACRPAGGMVVLTPS